MDKLREWLDGERGRLKALADYLEITHGAVCQWVRVPSERVNAVSEFTRIPREKLRPDLFGKPRRAA